MLESEGQPNAGNQLNLLHRKYLHLGSQEKNPGASWLSLKAHYKTHQASSPYLPNDHEEPDVKRTWCDSVDIRMPADQCQ